MKQTKIKAPLTRKVRARGHALIMPRRAAHLTSGVCRQRRFHNMFVGRGTASTKILPSACVSGDASTKTVVSRGTASTNILPAACVSRGASTKIFVSRGTAIKVRSLATQVGPAAEHFGGDNGFDDIGGDEDVMAMMVHWGTCLRFINLQGWCTDRSQRYLSQLRLRQSRAVRANESEQADRRHHQRTQDMPWSYRA